MLALRAAARNGVHVPRRLRPRCRLPGVRHVRRLADDAKPFGDVLGRLANALKLTALVGTTFSGGVAAHHWWTTPTPPTLWAALRQPAPAPYNLGGHNLVKREQFVGAIERCLDDGSGGVYVVWAPAQAGKTVYSETAAESWRKRGAGKTRHVKFFRTYDELATPNDLLERNLHVANASDLEQQLRSSNDEVLIVLDQFDEAFVHWGEQELHSFVVGLAQASQHGKNFRVVATIQDPDIANTVLGWNGGEKILLCGELPGTETKDILKFKWTEDEARQFLDGVGPEWTEEDKSLFAKAASRSGNIYKMAKMKENRALLRDASMQRRIEVDERKWDTGVECLAGRHERQLAAMSAHE